MGNVISHKSSSDSIPKEHGELWKFILSLKLKEEKDNERVYDCLVNNGIISLDHIKLIKRETLENYKLGDEIINPLITESILIQNDHIYTKPLGIINQRNEIFDNSSLMNYIHSQIFFNTPDVKKKKNLKKLN